MRFHPGESMALSALHRRLGRIGVISILTVALLGIWLLRGSHGKSILPSMSTSSVPRPSVKLRQGTYVGKEVGEGIPQVLEEWLGIPYGQSTAGKRRFREPLAMNASDDTFDAIDYADRCPAGNPNIIPMSEDCLNLNIYRPKRRSTGEKLPVLVHIFGGAFNFGAGSNRQVSNMVAWSAAPFIGVSFNYRVGAFGFLPSSLTAKEGLLNAGLKDQALLLEWVQENIAEFGGDPADVTLMGNSAGAHSIGHHLMHNPSKTPPFHKAIIESGAATARAVNTPSNPIQEKQFIEFLTKLGCEDVRDELKIQTLRNLTTNQIKTASEAIFNYYNPSVRWPFQPVIDGPGGFIEEAPIGAWKKGKWHRIPILTGFNTNEGAMFVTASMASGQQFMYFFRTLLPGLSNKDLVKLDEVYPDPRIYPSSKYRETRKGVGAQFKRVEQAYGHFAYTAPVRQTANFAAANDVPVYLYHFAVRTSVKGGADHGSHTSFPTYNKDVRDVSNTIDEIAGSMHAYWTSFITTGDPNKIKGRFPKRPVWPLYQPANVTGKLMMFGEGNNEIAGGRNVGIAVKVAEDSFAVKESEYWWNRTELFEL